MSGTNYLQLSGRANVREFGASGDGIGDDATGIGRAIAQVKAGGIVEIPPGIYRLGSSPSFASETNITIEVHPGATFTGTGSMPSAAGTNGYFTPGSAPSGVSQNIVATSANINLTTITSGDVNLVSAGAVNISANAISTIQTTSAGLTVQTVTLGTLAVNSAGTLSMSGQSAVNLNTGVLSLTAAIGIGNSGGGAVVIAGGAASSFTVTAANLTFSTATSGNVVVTSAGAINMTGTTNSLWTSPALIAIQTTAGGAITVSASGVLTLAGVGASVWTPGDGSTVVLGTSTGTKWGTVGGAAGQKQAWWNAAPIVQPLLATAAGHSVDDVITMLQSLGLCRQS